jgi:preprotein translocase subunit SecD
LVACLLALAVVGGCTSRVGGDAAPRPSPSSSSESGAPAEGPVELAEPVEFAPVVGTSPSGAPSPTATGAAPTGSTVPSEGRSPTTVSDADGVQYLLAEPFLTIDRLEGSRVALEPTGGNWVINLELSEEDGQVFGEWTTEHIGEQVAMVADGEVIFAPTIQSAITGGEIQIAGNYTQDQAREILDRIIGD